MRRANTKLLERVVRGLLLALAVLLPVAGARAQADASSSDAHEANGRLVLVLPFDNRSGQTNLQWIGESFPDTLNQRLNSAGFLTITRDDRQYALDHLGFPVDFRPTRATTIRIAQNLDADYVVVGSFNVQGSKIQVQAQVLEVNKLRLSAPLEDSSELSRLFDCENAVAWKVARQIDPHFSVAEQTFLASGGVRLSAFENYIRGNGAPTSAERVKRLQVAVNDQPGYSAALLALGKAQYSDRQYNEAAVTLGKVPKADHAALEANFYLGLARFNAAKYADAESAFSFVASRLPLPEVINNEAVAASRLGRDAGALFQRAASADPKDADYHFNLAVALLDRGDASGALREVNADLAIRPADTEAVDLRSRLQGAGDASGPALKKAIETGGFEPLERMRRTYSEASFRQAAFQLDQMRAMRLATLPPAEQAVQYTQQGRDYLAQGLIPEAELEFQAALGADANSAEAHAGLAQVREQSGNLDDARREAALSIGKKANVPAYLILARLDLQANQLAASAMDVSNALRVDPKNSAAMGMRQALLSRGQAIP